MFFCVLSIFTYGPVSYTHLDVYKRQPLDYAAFMKNPTQLDIGVYNMDTNEVEYFGKEYFDPIEQRLICLLYTSRCV